MAATMTAPAKAATSVFAGVPEAPPDPILGLNSAFLADETPGKISLGVGAFRTDEGKPYVLPVVKRVEQQLVRWRPSLARLCCGLGSSALCVGAGGAGDWQMHLVPARALLERPLPGSAVRSGSF